MERFKAFGKSLAISAFISSAAGAIFGLMAWLIGSWGPSDSLGSVLSLFALCGFLLLTLPFFALFYYLNPNLREATRHIEKPSSEMDAIAQSAQDYAQRRRVSE